MRREAGEVVWRIKLTVAAAFLGGWVGFCGWAWWLADGSGGVAGWGAGDWLAWAWVLVAGAPAGWARGELLIAAAAGAGVFAAPLVYLFFRKG